MEPNKNSSEKPSEQPKQQPKEPFKKNIKPNNKFNIYWIYALIFFVFIGLQFFGTKHTVKEISYIEFEREHLKKGDVQKIFIINKEIAEVYIYADSLKKPLYKDIPKTLSFNQPNNGPHYKFNIGTVEYFNEKIEILKTEFPFIEKIEIRFESRSDIWRDVLGWLPFIVIIIIWIVIVRRMSGRTGGGAGNIFNVGKSRAKLFDKETNIKIDFHSVAGLEEAKVEIKEIVDFLKNPKKYTDLGGKIPKGALLVGPPGTGKTLLAKAVAGEANVPFFSMSGSDFVEMFVGVGASRVRDLFKQAKEKAPSIVFIDEIDAIGRARGKNANYASNDERENTLNQLLSEMDGFGDNSGVIIMAATNRVDILDRALLRAGRFDRQIHVDLPDLHERKAIFDVHLKPLKLDTKLDRDFLARQTPGFSGADIANVCNEAALIAARGNKTQVEKQDFLDAIDRIVAGLERKNRIVTAKEKRTIAFHEAGHATVSWFSQYANPLIKVTIVPRGRALGAAWYLPEERQITTKEQLFDELAATLGGRAAEENIFGEVSTGALNDLERVTKQAYAMVSYYGMSDVIGNMSYYDSTGANEYAFSKPFSEKTAESIDKETKKIIDDAYAKAKNILTEQKQGLEKLANMLLEKEVIFKEDLEDVFGKRPFEEDPHHKDEKLLTSTNDELNNIDSTIVQS